MPLTEYYTTRQVASLLGLRVNLLEKWRMEKKGPPFEKAGWTVLYPKAGVHEWRRENAHARRRSFPGRRAAPKS